MIEIPEAVNLSKQVTSTLAGKIIADVQVFQSPHKFVWINGEAEEYESLLKGRTIQKGSSAGGFPVIQMNDLHLNICDGINLKYHETPKTLPKKHQLLFEFTDQTYLSFNAQMYGGISVYKPGEFDNTYFEAAETKPNPLTEDFTLDYFLTLTTPAEYQKLSLKAFLATEQRIPGLGNGVLQDILYNAGLHPKTKVSALEQKHKEALYNSIKETLKTMTEKGGRNTEKDLFGSPCGYPSAMSKDTKGQPCKVCGTEIQKAAYMGGSIYFCPECQPIL